MDAVMHISYSCNDFTIVGKALLSFCKGLPAKDYMLLTRILFSKNTRYIGSTHHNTRTGETRPKDLKLPVTSTPSPVVAA
ncbi:uncharacterized protein UV8b_05047 [Ustilaginoidea virens]|uniref:Uncharacterized protein n=1 Tax=Ustilaginoidea virens TaxID=1159556 RepID=A0A8E5MIA0_USTVR|nr:uncharacterized protein UV8b_05047 [Ustilaginoidea virens]QUC20806.1 hypothetical protein UV8b_05047 [Ustilaginoidea virens]